MHESGYHTDNLLPQVVGPPYRVVWPGSTIQRHEPDVWPLPPCAAAPVGRRQTQVMATLCGNRGI